MPSPSVMIVIVNWNLKEKIIECLKSVYRMNYPCRIVVVDNCSRDGSVEYIADHFPNVELLVSPRNLGFAVACNVAIRKGLRSGVSYFLLLNNDTTVHENMLPELIAAAETHPEAGILGPKVYSATDPRRLWHAGARRRQWVLAAVDFGRGQCDNGQFEQVYEVDYIFGCCMLIRHQVFEQIGLLDERFFLYLEDLDFCLRAQAAGYKLLFVPQARMWHQGSASTAQCSSLRKYHIVRSTSHFLRKHRLLIRLPMALLFWMLVFLRALVGEIARGDWKGIRAYSSGLFQEWR